jgi:hypothetical protein
MKTIDGNASSAVSRTLVHLFADSLHEIARGRGSSKGADDGHFADHQYPICSARFDKWCTFELAENCARNSQTHRQDRQPCASLDGYDQRVTVR